MMSQHTNNQWCSQKWAWQDPCKPTQKLHVQYTLIKQLKIVLKQSAGQAVPYQLNESGYTTI